MLPAQIAGWNQTRRDYPLDRPLTVFLEEQAKKTPELPAVVFENTLLTYGELHHRANRLARQLVARGIGTDALVGVYMERSIEMVVALLGIMKAGAAYVPLDPEYPQDRLAFMFEDSQIRVLVTQRKLTQPAAAAQLDVLYLDDPTWSAIEAVDRTHPPLASRPDSAAYMIYTSGSTGKPKGVVNVHQGLVNRLLWMQEAFQLTTNDRVLQ
jgi:non-ribosomal peptide synthetase component F